MKKMGEKRIIMRWIENRGGERKNRMWKKRGEEMKVEIEIGVEKEKIMEEVMKMKEGMREIEF